ncbi:hypothetical protein DFQ27_006212 [Actinomortierella ambigua]|uniref:Mediator of RNA polymerase II transcription subunit 9 n=1 Tax=Actinomortierella ambigua TaxID=1343610 RepID=A0A9P6U0S6_9FUNG|nr:hypothetical protein DFQ27_006212 [Actinomortierella ambigua]
MPSGVQAHSATAAAANGAEDAIMSFQPSDFSFLNQVLRILEKVETGDDPQEIATMAGNLKSSFQKCQMILDHLPGADISPDEQARILAEETAVLGRKKAQLQSYLSWGVFHHALPSTDSAPESDAVLPQVETAVDTPDVKIEGLSGELPHHLTATMSSSSFEPPSLDYSNTTLSTDGMLSQISEALPTSSQLKAEDKETGLTQRAADVKLEDEDDFINII